MVKRAKIEENMNFFNKNAPAAAKDIAEMKEILAGTSPSYEKWLINNNGGSLLDPVIVKSIEGKEISTLSHIFSLRQALDERIKKFGLFPKEWLPIGISLGGDFYVIDGNSGSVIYAPIESFYNKLYADNCNIKILSNNFIEFLSSACK